MSVYIHGDNILQKENHDRKYRDELSQKFLYEIRSEYEKWKIANLSLSGSVRQLLDTDLSVIEERTRLFNQYKDFLDQQVYAEHFDSCSNLHSSVFEEFMYYLFKDLVSDYSEHALIEKSHKFKDIFFRSDNYESMITSPNLLIEKKDHDFVIEVTINAKCKFSMSRNDYLRQS